MQNGLSCYCHISTPAHTVNMSLHPLTSCQWVSTWKLRTGHITLFAVPNKTEHSILYEYFWLPDIAIDEWVNKGHTKLNMFLVFGEQIKSLSSKQSKLNFLNRLHPIIVFLCSLLTQTATRQQNHTIWISSIKAILGDMTEMVLLEPNLGMIRMFCVQWEIF